MERDELVFQLNQCYAKLDAIPIDSFVLNREVEAIYKRIDELRDMCEHEYAHGFCKYCKKKEK